MKEFEYFSLVSPRQKCDLPELPIPDLELHS